MEGYAQILKHTRLKARVVGDAPMFDIVFTDRDVTDYRSSLGDAKAMQRLNALLRERGVLKSEGKHYISLAHTQHDVDHTLAAVASALGELARA
jgi:glutamate-1-semialdehyde 2,1-aminomutase